MQRENDPIAELRRSRIFSDLLSICTLTKASAPELGGSGKRDAQRGPCSGGSCGECRPSPLAAHSPKEEGAAEEEVPGVLKWSQKGTE